MVPVTRTEVEPGGGSWEAMLPPERRGAVMTVALEVAERTANPEPLAAAIRRPSFGVPWKAQTVAQGDAGLAVMCGQFDRCFPGQGWDDDAHRFLRLAVDAAEAASALPAGLMTGQAGLAFTATLLSRGGTRYQRLLAALDHALQARSRTLLDGPRAGNGARYETRLDVISGLSGIGAYLLARREPATDGALLKSILATLVAHIRAETRRSGLGAGEVDVGMAHGVPGRLALLALALRAGVELPGQRDALLRGTDWLARQRLEDESGVAWPAAASPGPAATVRKRPARMGWCYGTPGVARVLWISGQSLGEGAFCSLAIEAMEAVYRRPAASRGTDSPTFCHGIAGLLQITLRFARDTRLPVFTDAATVLAEQILDAYEPVQPGLLDGAAGVALVLLAAATDVPPSWDRLFMLA